MADFYSSHWGNNYSPRIRLSVGVANLNGNTARVTWILDYVASGYAAYTNGIARAWSVNIDGQVRSGSYNINGVSSTTRIANGTIDVARGTSARNISCSASLNFDVTWNGSYSGTRSASGSIGVEKRVSYTVAFNANGGTGAPGNQTKWHGQNITLSSTRPTRTGYIFKGWAKSPSGRVEYQPGSVYGIDASVTFYAIWSPETYTISFNANGGSGAPGNQTKTYGQTLTLSSTRPTRTNYNFIGWGTSSGSTSAAYQPGGSYTSNGNATLYAVWQLAYTPPRITNIQADRCDSGGNLSESGTYVKVSFRWATDYNVSAIYIRHKVSTNSTWTTTTVSASGKTGSVSQVIGSNGISTEYTYNIQIEIRDSNGSSIAGQNVGAMLYTIDFKAGGKGVAIGKPATVDNRLEVALEARVDQFLSVGGNVYADRDLKVSGTLYLKGKTLLDTFYPVGSIFISIISTNPSSYMGGTWVRFGNSQTLVGVNENDPDFNTAYKAGGSKLNSNFLLQGRDYGGLSGGSTGGEYKGRVWVSPTTLSNNDTVAQPFPQSNLQPYTTVYFWRRTA